MENCRASLEIFWVFMMWKVREAGHFPGTGKDTQWEGSHEILSRQ